jgi:phosphonate transport system substrate-binding protein
VNSLRVLFPPSLGVAKASARAELVERSLATALARPVQVRVAVDYDDLLRSANANAAEVVWAPAGLCAKLAPVARTLFQVVRNGLAHYRSALVVPAQSKLTLDRLSSARSLRAAWVDPHSLGGHLLAIELLRRRGVEPSLVFSEQRFMGSHPEALAAVADGRADLAAVTAWSGDVRDVRSALSMHVGPLESRLTVLAVTDEAPTDALVLTRSIDEDAAAGVESLLDFEGRPAKRNSMLPSAMGAERFVHATLEPYLTLQRRMRASVAPPR